MNCYTQKYSGVAVHHSSSRKHEFSCSPTTMYQSIVKNQLNILNLPPKFRHLADEIIKITSNKEFWHLSVHLLLTGELRGQMAAGMKDFLCLSVL